MDFYSFIRKKVRGFSFVDTLFFNTFIRKQVILFPFNQQQTVYRIYFDTLQSNVVWDSLLNSLKSKRVTATGFQ